MGVPHVKQGWGRIDLRNTLFPPGSGQVLFDDNLDNAISTEDIRTYDLIVSSPNVPLVITLVWRDPPDDTIQNRLHLRVIHIDSDTRRTSDNIDDIHNNVQKIVITEAGQGPYRMEVEGINVTRGIPEFPDAVRQDYALVVANANELALNLFRIILHKPKLFFERQFATELWCVRLGNIPP